MDAFVHVADLPAARRAREADLGVLATDMPVMLGTAGHEVERHAANLRAVEHDPHVLRPTCRPPNSRQWFIAIDRQVIWQSWQASMHACISGLV
ncbi:hypothetical protein [Edaphosphingomonas haloaromaticamans]|uniref:hypothetical protein n=1 Tax=Edaphosphingomonas haloaromaticamans TaxID=653954 RepID=UPI001748628A|nr:hypothetical protein [Sphingomonas haloaromaticamans]